MVSENTSRETSCMNAVDTNVFVYMMDDDDPAKQTKARELIDQVFTAPQSAQ